MLVFFSKIYLQTTNNIALLSANKSVFSIVHKYILVISFFPAHAKR